MKKIKIKEGAKRKIGIDIDEVVVKFMEGYLKFYNLKYKTFFNLKDITHYHLWECGLYTSKKNSIKEVLDFQNSNEFDALKMIEGAKFGLNEISKNHKICFITSRPIELKEKTIDFFYKHFPKNGYEFIFSGEVYGGLTKSRICNKLQIEKMVEDNADYALDCAKNGIKTFLLNKPWNRNYEKHKNIIKVQTWRDILKKLK